MMKILRKFILLTCLTGSISTLFAQEMLVLSLDEAVNYAIEYNKQMKNAGLAVDEAQKKINETIFSGLPQVDATIDYSNFMGAEMEFQFGEGVPPRIIPFNPTSNLNVTLGQLIFNGSYIVGLQSARIYKELAQTSFLKTEQDIKEQVTRSYLLALVSERSMEILKKNMANTESIYEKTKLMAHVGMAENLDVDQFEVQLNSLENAMKSSERQSEVAYNLLRFQLGLSVDAPIELSDSLPELVVNLENNSVDSDPFNLDNNLDYQIMLTQEKLSQKQITLQKMDYLPTVTGFYRYTEKILRPELDFSPKNVVGLNVNVPIFSSGMRYAQLSQARIQYETAHNNMALLSDQLLLQEKQYRFNFRNAYDQYENRMKNVAVAYRVYQNYQLKYEQGVASSLDLATSNSNYLQAESEYISSIIGLFDAHLALQKLLNSL